MPSLSRNHTMLAKPAPPPQDRVTRVGRMRHHCAQTSAASNRLVHAGPAALQRPHPRTCPRCGMDGIVEQSSRSLRLANHAERPIHSAGAGGKHAARKRFQDRAVGDAARDENRVQSRATRHSRHCISQSSPTGAGARYSRGRLRLPDGTGLDLPPSATKPFPFTAQSSGQARMVPR